eukprot:3642922-Pleurochrysis_carterae.AAC.2
MQAHRCNELAAGEAHEEAFFRDVIGRRSAQTLVQRLDPKRTVEVHRTGAFEGKVLARAGGALDLQQKFAGMDPLHPFAEEVAVALGIVRAQR